MIVIINFTGHRTSTDDIKHNMSI